ncbi:MAG: PSD1 domain-containing protein [Planctomycetaceae bacterium]|nr:PSD1 domain-containing protein [Planctomycetaceae bacterium]
MNWLIIVDLLQVLLVGVATDDRDFFVQHVRPIFQKHCYDCHSGAQAKSGFRLDIKAAAFRGGELYGTNIHAGQPKDSLLLTLVADPNAELPMPPDGTRLSTEEIQVLEKWIQSGAHWPEDVDAEKLLEPTQHWSFQAVVKPLPPAVKHPRHQNPIDDFIASHLAQYQLEPAPEADKSTWLRRVTLDLTGLPPTPADLEQFLADHSDSAHEAVVERLLASPEYGPRWAQHWLDVVRYADTHGFEVNTERPHAWPYRDYVIEAFQQDKPYDRFIREQLIGDQLGEDAATGFLLTASVLLPGQIGQDDASKRLARQDALDEIVTNIGQTFMGLSIGCARCHDHRFDPISQRDYYSFQALVAGVEYADRTWRKMEVNDRQQQLIETNARLRALEQQLRLLEPLAAPKALADSKPMEVLTATLLDDKANEQGAPFVPFRRPAVRATYNIDRFAPLKTTRVRFTILRTNRLEPCLDELEVWNTTGENVARQEPAPQVTASGDTVAIGTHERRFINDGVYGNSSSWMSNVDGGGWIQYEWSEPQEIDAVTWGRDRNGQYDDRLASEYCIEIWDADLPATGDSGEATGAWRVIADHSDRQLFGTLNEPNATLPNEIASVGDRQRQQELLQQHQQLERQRADLQQSPQVFGGQFRTPDRTFLLRRGNPELPQMELPPAMLSVFGERSLATETEDVARRTALADWLTEPSHPLVARVMVNRIWQGHFGAGLVATPSDFGRNGQTPSHPELLDWLASEFVESGWSIKSLHRWIVLSATYRQASRHHHPAAMELDREVRWLWRFPGRRLEAETIRDSQLFVAGQLNTAQGGPGFDFFAQRGGLSGFVPVEVFAEVGRRRMVFAHKVRRERDVVFGAFDCPDGGQSTATRRVSTTPIQALNLLNSPFVVEQAEALATRIVNEVGQVPEAQIERLWQHCFSRMPSANELAAADSLIGRHGLSSVCRAVLNSNEFLHLP